MDQTIDLSPAEWRIMEYLWEKSPLTGRELTEQLGHEVGWSRSTTLTLLRRMESKGMVCADSSGTVKQYFPAVQRMDAAMQETENFLHRVYQGSLSLMVSAMTKKKALPQKEIDELYAMLQKLEGDESDA